VIPPSTGMTPPTQKVQPFSLMLWGNLACGQLIQIGRVLFQLLYEAVLTNKSERKDTHNWKASAAWMRMASLQGWLYGDFSIVGILVYSFQ